MNIMKKKGGFTLVELIVVIAILAILAGVAIPVYSGYIKKAETAADNQLLGAINTAFSASCAANGIATTDVSGAQIPVDAEGKIGTTTFAMRAAEKNYISSVTFKSGITADTTKINTDFAAFFAGNENSAFKGIKSRSLMFDPAKGMFVDPQNEDSVTVFYGGGYIQVSGTAIDALLNSSFYGEGMTSEALLQQVDSVAVIASGMGPIQKIMETPEFGAFAMEALGVKTQAEYEAKANEIVLAKLGWDKDFDITNATAAESQEYIAALEQVKANALVLYTAQKTTQMGDSAKDLLNGIDSATIKLNMTSGTVEEKQTAMNQAALAYGMYYAYASSKGMDTTKISSTDVMNALDGQNAGFTAYMKEAQSGKDMKAYLEALSVINQSATGNPDAVEQLLTNGFVDLDDLLTGAMGK